MTSRPDQDRDPRARPAPGGGARDHDEARDRDVAQDHDAARDRDAAGRPRNARPRDGLGRPLPRSAPKSTERLPDDLAITPGEAAALGGSLLAQGRPFHAHEVFEAAWKTGPPAEGRLWQGLAQLAVGVTHARRGNPRGAVSLLRRGADRIRDYSANAPDARPYGIDLSSVISRAEDLATAIERDGLPAIPEASLRFPLTP